MQITQMRCITMDYVHTIINRFLLKLVKHILKMTDQNTLMVNLINKVH